MVLFVAGAVGVVEPADAGRIAAVGDVARLVDPAEIAAATNPSGAVARRTDHRPAGPAEDDARRPRLVGDARAGLRAAGQGHRRPELLPEGRGRARQVDARSTTPTTSSPYARPVRAGLGPPRLRRSPGVTPSRASPSTRTARCSTARSSDAADPTRRLRRRLRLDRQDGRPAARHRLTDPCLVRRGAARRRRRPRTALMQRALDRAPTAVGPGVRAVLPRRAGVQHRRRRQRALTLYNRATAGVAARTRPPLAGKAKAEAALGQIETALDHYRQLVDRYPEPSYVLEYGELLESLGRDDEAAQAVRRVHRHAAAVRGQRRRARRVGDAVRRAPRRSGAGTRRRRRPASPPDRSSRCTTPTRGHCTSTDATTKRSGAVDAALQTGLRNALFHYHAGMISCALGDDDGARHAS